MLRSYPQPSNQEHFTWPKSNYGNNMSNNYDNNLLAHKMTDVTPALSNTKVIDWGCDDFFVLEENIKNRDKIFTHHFQAVNNLSQLVFWKIGQKWNTSKKKLMNEKELNRIHIFFVKVMC